LKQAAHAVSAHFCGDQEPTATIDQYTNNNNYPNNQQTTMSHPYNPYQFGRSSFQDSSSRRENGNG
jgi:ribonuclease HIII